MHNWPTGVPRKVSWAYKTGGKLPLVRILVTPCQWRVSPCLPSREIRSPPDGWWAVSSSRTAGLICVAIGALARALASGRHKVVPLGKFLIDAQLHARLARFLTNSGHDALHRLELPEGTARPMPVSPKFADGHNRVVITKD